MSRPRLFYMVLATLAAIAFGTPPGRAQDSGDLGGRWTLDRTLSQFPREIGFNADWMTGGGSDSGAGSTGAGGGRGGRRGSSGGGAGPMKFPARPESADEATRRQQLTDEVRTPPVRLTIVDTPDAVTITDDQGRSRTLHPTGRDDVIQVGTVSTGVDAKREDGKLVIEYHVEEGRTLRYTYSRAPAAEREQLIVDVEFVQHGGGDKVRRVYDRGGAADTAAPPAPSARQAPSNAAPPPREMINQKPDAELIGITKLVLVVEDLSAQAAACGLTRSAIESAVSKRLTDAGFTVRRNTDDETSLYVNVITTSISSGLCVSRYDVSLDTYTTAKLAYQTQPVLVQVELLHKGALAGGPPAAHAEAVLRGIQENVDQFISRIRSAGSAPSR